MENDNQHCITTHKAKQYHDPYQYYIQGWGREQIEIYILTTTPATAATSTATPAAATTSTITSTDELNNNIYRQVKE